MRPLRIAWYVRDGHLRLFPTICQAMKDAGCPLTPFYVCHNQEEGLWLRSRGLEASAVLADVIDTFRLPDVSPATIAALSRRYYEIPLVRHLWGELFELQLSEAERLSNLVAHFRFWEQFFVAHQIDVFVAERPSLLSTCVAWSVCRDLGVRFLDFIDIPPISGRLALSSSWEGHYNGLYEQAAKSLAGSEPHRLAVAYVQALRRKPEKTIEAQLRLTVDRRTRYKLAWRLPSVIRRIRWRAQYYPYPRLRKRMTDPLLIFLNRWLYTARGFFQDGTSPTDEFFLMPLHSSREWSNYTWMGADYADQPGLVKRVAEALPPGMWLYVKEHTAGFGERPPSYYAAIRACRQVRLLPPDANTFELLDRSRGVVTLGSTMGFEAIMLGRPVFLLGNPWYAKFPGAFRAHSIEELADLIHRADDLPLAKEEEKVQYVAALFAISFEGVKWPHPRTLDSENIHRLAVALQEALIAPARDSCNERDAELVGNE